MHSVVADFYVEFHLTLGSGRYGVLCLPCNWPFADRRTDTSSTQCGRVFTSLFPFFVGALFQIVFRTHAGGAHIAFLAYLLLKSEIKWNYRQTGENHSDPAFFFIFFFCLLLLPKYIYCPLWTKQLLHTFLLLHSFEYKFKFSRTMGIGLVLANNIFCRTNRSTNERPLSLILGRRQRMRTAFFFLCLLAIDFPMGQRAFTLL